MADLDAARATRAMFEFERGGMADVLFAGTVRPGGVRERGPDEVLTLCPGSPLGYARRM